MYIDLLLKVKIENNSIFIHNKMDKQLYNYVMEYSKAMKKNKLYSMEQHELILQT